MSTWRFTEKHKSFKEFVLKEIDINNTYSIVLGSDVLKFKCRKDNEYMENILLLQISACELGNNFPLYGTYLERYNPITDTFSKFKERDYTNKKNLFDILHVFFEEIPKDQCDHGVMGNNICFYCMINYDCDWGHKVERDRIYSFIKLGYSDFPKHDNYEFEDMFDPNFTSITLKTYYNIGLLIAKLKDDNKKLQEKITELEFRPPNEGGKYYNNAKEEFEKLAH
jgi:hypothetical protein